MGLTAILEAIQAAGEARVREIEMQAQIRAQEVLMNAEVEVQCLREEARAIAIAQAAGERARIIHHTRLQALRIVGDVREVMVDRALDQTRGRLAGTRTAPSYPVVLRRLTEEALAELDYSPERIGKVKLHADPRDRVLLECILFDMGLDLPVRYELNCWGGLIAKSEDDRLVVINTLEARLERATPNLCRYLATLFEEGPFESAASWDELAVEV